jgi:hypothetical protein
MASPVRISNPVYKINLHKKWYVLVLSSGILNKITSEFWKYARALLGTVTVAQLAKKHLASKET